MTNRNKGVALIDVLVIIAIIGILALLIIEGIAHPPTDETWSTTVKFTDCTADISPTTVKPGDWIHISNLVCPSK